ncbi:MAG: hypothetical protein IJV99_00655 [Clostridia bacterium]|nr:hypothetical protein [Clostridia bacterium]
MAKTRNRLLVVLSVLMAFAFMFGIFGFRTAKADSASMVTSFTMSESQSVRVDDHKGMRFYAVLSNTDYQNLFGSESNYEDVEFGYFIMPAYYEEILGDINEESTFGDQAVYTWEGKEGAGTYTVIHNVGAYPVLDTQGEISQGNYLIKGSVVNMYPQNLATKYTARMYVKATNKTTQATEYQFATKAKTTASMIDVAIKALDAGVQDDSLQGYIDSYNAWHTTEKGSAPTFTYTVNYVSGGEIVKSVVSEQSYAINTPVSITATAPEGYLLDQAMADSNVLSGKIFADNSLVLTVYVTNLTEETMEGSLYNKELYYFDKSSAEDASVVLPKAIGKVSALAIGGTVIDSANFSYEDATKTLTVKADAISALATGDVDMVITGATAIYTAKVTVADVVLKTAQDILDKVSDKKITGYYVLGNDIENVTGHTAGYGTGVLSGVLDGKGFAIKNLTMESNARGLFDRIDSTGIIRNIGLINFTHKMAETAFLVNENRGTVQNVFASGVNAGRGGLVNTNYATAKLINVIANISGTSDYALVNAFIYSHDEGAVASDLYAISNYASLLPGVTEGNFATTKAFFEYFKNGLPATFDKQLWSFDNSGNLCFGDEIAIYNTKDLVGAKNFGELFYFSKDVTTPTGYANEYVKDGFYNIAIPENFTETKIDTLTIGTTEVTGFIYADKVLKVPTSAISSVANGEIKLVIVSGASSYQATATVADSVLYDMSDVCNVLPTATSISSGKLIVLDRNINWDTTTIYKNTTTHMYATLDGKGYSIIGLKVDPYLWRTLQSGTVIKNIGFLNTIYHASAGLFAGEIGSITIDNVAVSIAAGACSGYVNSMTHNITLRDSIMVCNSSSYGIAKTYTNTRTLTVDNSFCVTNTDAFKTVGNVEDTIYVNAKATVCADIATLKTKSENLKNFDSDYWTIDASGNICFGGEIVVKA